MLDYSLVIHPQTAQCPDELRPKQGSQTSKNQKYEYCVIMEHLLI